MLITYSAIYWFIDFFSISTDCVLIINILIIKRSKKMDNILGFLCSLKDPKSLIFGMKKRNYFNSNNIAQKTMRSSSFSKHRESKIICIVVFETAGNKNKPKCRNKNKNRNKKIWTLRIIGIFFFCSFASALNSIEPRVSEHQNQICIQIFLISIRFPLTSLSSLIPWIVKECEECMILFVFFFKFFFQTSLFVRLISLLLVFSNLIQLIL